MTPPAFASRSGTTVMPAACRIASASGVLGPLAPSTTSWAVTRDAMSAVRVPSMAAGDDDVAGDLERAAVDGVARRVLHERVALCGPGDQRGHVESACGVNATRHGSP